MSDISFDDISEAPASSKPAPRKFEPNPQQAQAIEDGIHWWNHSKSPDNNIFSVTGVAGSGKTTTVETLLSSIGIAESTALIAPTWKAARVLRHRTGRETSSMHSLIYVPKADALSELKRALMEEMHSKEPSETAIEALQSEMEELQALGNDLQFVLNPMVGEKTQNLSAILLDEASMTGEEPATDLRSLGIPLILVYDPFQLPPVKAKFGFEDVVPNVFLTQIMRTGEGSGVAFAAGDIREGRELRSYGDDFRIVPRGKLNFENYARDFDMIICGTNKVRRRMNDGIRNTLGLPKYPVAGDRIISLSNQDCGISNGEIFTIEKINSIQPRVINMDVIDAFGNRFRHVRAWREIFEDDSKTFRAPLGMGLFTYGYAMTAHKAQGSEAPRVCVLDDWRGADYTRWLYTAVTRASQSCVFVR